MCVCGSVCVCPEDRAVTEVNGAVSVCNVILTVSLAQTKHRGTVVEIKLGLFTVFERALGEVICNYMHFLMKSLPPHYS